MKKLLTFSSLIILSFMVLASNKTIPKYHHVSQEYDNSKNNRITDRFKNSSVTLSNGDIVNLSLFNDYIISVTINGEELLQKGNEKYSQAVINEDEYVLYLYMISGKQEVIDLTTKEPL